MYQAPRFQPGDFKTIVVIPPRHKGLESEEARKLAERLANRITAASSTARAFTRDGADTVALSELADFARRAWEADAYFICEVMSVKSKHISYSFKDMVTPVLWNSWKRKQPERSIVLKYVLHDIRSDATEPVWYIQTKGVSRSERYGHIPSLYDAAGNALDEMFLNLPF